MRMYDLILKKRRCEELTEEEIQYIITHYVNGAIPDYQMSAFLMTIMFQGMTHSELATFTMAMAQSGTVIDLSPIEGVKVDKHSTGGVGDKTTLIIAAIVAACGGKVAKMSGRGLGHTGGTIDKMESIPGLMTTLTEEQFIEQVNRIGFAVIGQSDEIAPADKKIYALRDVTATVDSIPLIASSIMSKKLASGADAILLDVKVGSGAFMKTLEDARALARAMVDIGCANGKIMRAVITDMDVPLGHSIGNALEIKEVIATLHNQGPQDLTHECLVMAGHMLVMVHKGLYSYEECFYMAKEALQSGRACECLRAMIVAQGGDSDVLDNIELLGNACYSYSVRSPESGYIVHMNAEQCGIAAVMLGAGRLTKNSPIDMTAGIVMHKKTGDFVEADEVIATLYANDSSVFDGAAITYIEAITIGRIKPYIGETILDTIL